MTIPLATPAIAAHRTTSWGGYAIEMECSKLGFFLSNVPRPSNLTSDQVEFCNRKYPPLSDDRAASTRSFFVRLHCAAGRRSHAHPCQGLEVSPPSHQATASMPGGGIWPGTHGWRI